MTPSPIHATLAMSHPSSDVLRGSDPSRREGGQTPRHNLRLEPSRIGEGLTPFTRLISKGRAVVRRYWRRGPALADALLDLRRRAVLGGRGHADDGGADEGDGRRDGK